MTFILSQAVDRVGQNTEVSCMSCYDRVVAPTLVSLSGEENLHRGGNEIKVDLGQGSHPCKCSRVRLRRHAPRKKNFFEVIL